jgi:hypothetical protein
MTSKRNQFISTRGRGHKSASGTWGRNQNMTAYLPAAKLGPVAHTVLVALLIALLGLLYLTQLTKTSSFSYEISEIDNRRAELVAERDDLKVENARLQSLTRVKDSSVAASMTAPVSTDYASN